MPAADAEQVIRLCTPVALPARFTLQMADSDIKKCYFIEQGLVSLVARLKDGDPLEIGLIGPEGLVGEPALLGATRAPAEAVVQLEGSALSIEADALKSVFESNANVRAVLLRHVQAMQVQVAQTAACNGRHEVEPRLARWLLMAADKYDNKPMPFTQEFLSMMLGVRRQQVSISAAALQKAGFIQYRHGVIEIRDRAGLESAACECYGIVAREFDRLLN